MAQVTKRDETVITRGVYWMNNQQPGLAMIEEAGYDVQTADRTWGREHRVSRDGSALAHIHEFTDDEAFAFLFAPEARAPRWRRILWRLTHPFASPALPAKSKEME